MGNRHNLPIFQPSQWHQFDLQNQEDYGQFSTLKHHITSQLVDQYFVQFIDRTEYKRYLKAFEWRLQQPSIVRTLFLKQQPQQQLCSSKYLAKVYIQHPSNRLSTIKFMSYPHYLSLCVSVINGYQKLYQRYGSFKVQPNQICIGYDGEVRVWLNSNLSKNYPDINYLQKQINESEMVQQLILTISHYTDQKSRSTMRKLFQQPSGFQFAKDIMKKFARDHRQIQQSTNYKKPINKPHYQMHYSPPPFYLVTPNRYRSLTIQQPMLVQPFRQTNHHSITQPPQILKYPNNLPKPSFNIKPIEPTTPKSKPTPIILPKILDLSKAKVQYSFQDESPLLKQKRSEVEILFQANNSSRDGSPLLKQKIQGKNLFEIKLHSLNPKHNHNHNSKTVYYTRQSIQELDPQIAQDLKKFNINQ